MASPKGRPVPPVALDGLLKYLPVAVGATNSYPHEFPSEFPSIGINRRDPGRNTYVGMTVSRPTDDLGVYGLTWEDKDEAQEDEDFVTLDVRTAIATTWPAKMFENAYPQYAQLHHAAKPHLRVPPSKSSS